MLPSSPHLDFRILSKTFNFNWPLKLDREAYVNWSVQILATVRALELKTYISDEGSPPPKVIQDPTSPGDTIA